MDKSYIERFTVNFSELVARDPDKHGAYERGSELRQIVRTLNQERKNSVAIVGEAGVGKTALVEELAKRIKFHPEDVPTNLRNKQILGLELSALMEYQDGATFASNLYNLIDEIKANKDLILFIDEMHELIGTGADGKSSMDAANILKPAIGRGEIQVIGATTLEEYHEYIESDKAIRRRFSRVHLSELTTQQTLDVLKKIKPDFERRIGIEIADGEDLLEAVVSFADRFITTEYFPDKAVTLLDSALSEAKLNKRSFLKFDDIAEIIHEQYFVPMSVLTESDNARLYKLFNRMQADVIGQDAALLKITNSIRVRAAGLGDMSKPISFLLAGTPGVGKTETAKSLARHYFGGEDQIIRFDMSEFKFAKVSMELFIERAAEAVKYHPYSVFLLDEIEKADPMVWDLLLQILDDGRLTDRYGQLINFKDLIVVMTTNIGHSLILDRSERSEAYKQNETNVKTFRQDFESALRGAGMRQELISRIGSVIIYNPLENDDVLRIIDLKMDKLAQQAAKQHYQIVYKPDAVTKLIPTFAEHYEELGEQRQGSYPLTDYLLERGYKRSLGVRPLDDVILENVEALVAEGILKERRTGQSDGHTFVFRTWGNPPDAKHPRGRWETVVTQFELTEEAVDV
ncbi:ATP-binding subunit of Clp protease and DnaK/DnaJ chaperones [Weissella oryzae SG25]|uniref:ATP-binding subunit of Clp protease and DnaK/DnaJ chaperones n=1 Tax=Weissella oryzae (strain DSM 25784 / JCM 18191 / LMG 30913 / SG25) TaxID=1329250 RepID=A0A069CUY1_WEIOS|nr:ATP-dependent Clp protease ATP-binding subunit [Weissella oryzae]GAK31048.1 ATP-binding subunit of Clp protease and DnaK/DnaJ chaperones [Weissella oryzae SG25]